jgi:hypothetical protein
MMADLSSNDVMADLLGISEDQVDLMLEDLQFMARRVYWGTLHDAIAVGLRTSRVWDGAPEKLGEALEFLKGQLKIIIDPEAGGVIQVFVMGTLSATVQPPTSAAVYPPNDKRVKLN